MSKSKNASNEKWIRDKRIEMIISLWKKHFGHLTKRCDDCGGFSIFVCETALRKILVGTFNKIEKTLLREQKERILKNPTKEELNVAIVSAFESGRETGKIEAEESFEKQKKELMRIRRRNRVKIADENFKEGQRQMKESFKKMVEEKLDLPCLCCDKDNCETQNGYNQNLKDLLNNLK